MLSHYICLFCVVLLAGRLRQGLTMYSRLTLNFQRSSCLCLPKCWDYRHIPPLASFMYCSRQCLDVEPIYWGYCWVILLFFFLSSNYSVAQAAHSFFCVSLLSTGIIDTEPLSATIYSLLHTVPRKLPAVSFSEPHPGITYCPCGGGRDCVLSKVLAVLAHYFPLLIGPNLLLGISM